MPGNANQKTPTYSNIKSNYLFKYFFDKYFNKLKSIRFFKNCHFGTL